MKPFLTTSLLAILTLSSPDQAHAERPNVILIMADDMGYEALGCHGSSFKTPHLDQLAKDGARFTNCHSTPLCTPSRVLIMTGRYGFRNYRTFGILDPKEKTFGHMMKEAGYATCMAGKWQLGTAKGPGTNPSQAGFDEYLVWNYSGEPGKTGERYANPTLIGLDRKTKKERFFQSPEGYGPDLCSDYLLEFLDQQADGKKPFFIWYPMILTHDPFVPTPHSKEWSNAKKRSQGNTKHFKDMVEYTDHLVGRLLAKLEKQKLKDNTLILFTTDNGTSARVKTLMADGSLIQGGKGFSKDTGTHVPLIVRWPGVVAPKQVTNQMVDFSDFLPTLAQASGAALPKPPGDGILDGKSFLPAISKELKGPLRESIYNYYIEKRQNQFGWPRSIFARDQRYKLYGFYERTVRKSNKVIAIKTGQMFDVVNDPNELHPIAMDEAKETRERLRRVLNQLGPIPESSKMPE